MARRSSTRYIDPIRVAIQRDIRLGCLVRTFVEGLGGRRVRVDSLYWNTGDGRTNAPPEVYAEVELNWSRPRRETRKMKIALNNLVA